MLVVEIRGYGAMGVDSGRRGWAGRGDRHESCDRGGISGVGRPPLGFDRGHDGRKIGGHDGGRLAFSSFVHVVGETRGPIEFAESPGSHGDEKSRSDSHAPSKVWKKCIS
eukprot:517979-Amorphochlora_amoeboformis.AAC.2